ncbi:glycoside hydrolase family 97 protein [Olivibacter sp. XZL3]|uniref:glycoside hydrolase family 97 protein n=1 Tax=Olivibacter sp. XZL3 TaxID=1735116 RepID=UPI001065687C|nr:glycoside hydrolase family 97 protein [Olivibacter sp. XZL3]
MKISAKTIRTQAMRINKPVFLPYMFLFALSAFSSYTKAEELELQSPDGKQRVRVEISDSLRLSVQYDGLPVIRSSAIGLELADETLGRKPKLLKQKTFESREEVKPLYGQSARITDDFNALTLFFQGDYTLMLRAYNEGVAYRFVTSKQDSLEIVNEIAHFALDRKSGAVLPMVENFTSWEVPYEKYTTLDSIAAGKHSLTPALFLDEQKKLKTVIAEAAVFDYPGMYLQLGPVRVKGLWAAYPAQTELGSWGNFVSVVKERKPFIARTAGTRAFPWRVIMATTDETSLLSNHLVYLLNEDPDRGKDYSWVKPGKAAWEWWHDAILTGGSIPSGMDNRNTALYTYYVDFAARNRLEYMMVDAGWSNVYDLKKGNPQVDIKAVIKHARSRNVNVFLWCVATTLLDDLEGNLDFIKSLGAVGVKVDFFDRDDQLAMRSMERIARAAAARQLLVNFHGCTKPSGWQRKYPHVLNYEAVRGEECSKWDYTSDPDYHLLIPYIRMLAGPLDYTPGSMRNATKEVFKPVDPGLPSTMGTRCHELSLFVLFDQPLAMLSDSPDEYEKYPDVLEFLSDVPTVFDETKALQGRLGEYLVLAKRKNDDWFVGLSTNWAKRQLTVDFSFLPVNKNYQLKLFRDDLSQPHDASSYIAETLTVNSASKLDLHLAAGGGAVMQLTLVE